MQRAAIALLLFVLLLNARHPVIRKQQQPETMLLTATPLSIEGGEVAHLLGPLRYLGGWSLEASRSSFGGISSLRVADDGSILALSDGGEVMRFSVRQAKSTAQLRQLPILPEEKGAPRSFWDTESMAVDPVSGKVWVGFEFRNRICRYSAGFLRVERCHAPPAIREWPVRTGMEALARMPDGRFIAIAEDARGPEGVGHDMLVFAGDPVEPSTPPPLRLAYRAPQGYLPTDAVAIDDDRLLVMNRRVTLASGFTGILTMVDLRTMAPGRLLTGHVVARLMAPLPHDNFEAIAISRQGDDRLLWVASDDNHLFFQRTLLLKFAMPPAWFGAATDKMGSDGVEYIQNARFPRAP